MECPMEDWNSKEKQERSTPSRHYFLVAWKCLEGCKMFADVVEAVLGACYLEGGIKLAVHVMNQLGIAPLDKIHHTMRQPPFLV